MPATMTMKSQVQAFSTGCKSSRRTAVVVRAEGRPSSSALERVQLAAATFVTAAVLASPADAGVVLEQPKLKKVLYDESAEAPAPRAKMELRGLTKRATSSAPATQSSEAPVAKTAAAGDATGFKFDLDPFVTGLLALPAAIGGIGAAAFLATKLDGGFVDFIREASVRDSNNFAGYEPTLKPESGPIDFKSIGGTKKIKAQPKRVVTVVKKSGKTLANEGTGSSFGLPGLPSLPSLPIPFVKDD